MLKEIEKEEIQREIGLWPYPAAACIDALKIVQEHRGWISDEVVNDVANELGMAAAEVESIATFYTRLYRKPIGRNVILVCDGPSCMIMGYETLYGLISSRLGIGSGETTADGRFTLLPVSCLGDCDHAPALMVNHDHYNNVSVDDLESILEKYDKDGNSS